MEIITKKLKSEALKYLVSLYSAIHNRSLLQLVI